MVAVCSLKQEVAVRSQAVIKKNFPSAIALDSEQVSWRENAIWAKSALGSKIIKFSFLVENYPTTFTQPFLQNAARNHAEIMTKWPLSYRSLY